MKSIPNILTISRILFFPFIFVIYYSDNNWNNFFACFLFTTIALTDLLDGYIARKYQASSKLGEFLDPIADKIIAVACMILIVGEHKTYIEIIGEHSVLWLVIPTVIMVTRELIMAGMREILANEGQRNIIQVNSLGKWKTLLQLIAIGFLIFNNWSTVVYIGYSLYLIATILTLISFASYIWASLDTFINLAKKA